ncbi:hypothetical protein BMF94_0554 [Rhodotorula taiwanensis]|uniref:Zinc finger C2H2 LYAR-type domain-containing protein n=1 Tax=Rhodotorula taiwanensis TaxID=741276 RepID=A0A2S5BHW4_9BASI|nr:hypothetical protein BMF94_0554 [Rhodotorula taiwanensis]
MVSFSCESCCDIMKKPKLDAHAQRCRGAQFTCIDCNTTFEGTAYRSHTSCVSEEQRYHKSVYKPPKGKGKNGQQQQQQQQQQQKPAVTAQPEASTSTAAPAPAASTNGTDSSKKRNREEEQAPKQDAEKKKEDAAASVVNGSADKTEAEASAGGEPDKKKKKKDKKKSKKDAESTESATPSSDAASAKPSIPEFLTSVVQPLLKADGDVSLANVRQKVVEAAKEKGLEVQAVEEQLWAGLKVGGKKGKVRAEFA